MDNLERVKTFLKSLDDEDIIFKRHFHIRALERPIDEAIVRENIKKTGDILKIGRQLSRIEGEEKFNIWIAKILCSVNANFWNREILA